MYKYWLWNGIKVTAKMIKDGIITTAKIANKAITEDKIDDSLKAKINNDYLITFTQNNPTSIAPPTFTCDKTFEEIYAAYSAGKNLIAKIIVDLGDENFSYIICKNYYIEDTLFDFSFVDCTDTLVSFYTMMIYEDGDIVYYQSDISIN